MTKILPSISDHKNEDAMVDFYKINRNPILNFNGLPPIITIKTVDDGFPLIKKAKLLS